MDDRSAGTAPKVATRELFEGRGPLPQVPAVWPGLQGQAQPVEAFEVRVWWPQELQLRAMRAQFYAERQSAPSPDAEPQLLSAAKEAMHSEDCQMKSCLVIEDRPLTERAVVPARNHLENRKSCDDISVKSDSSGHACLMTV